MKYNLPTREDCQNIVKNSEAFYCKEGTIQGYKYEMYDYRFATYNDFVNLDAWELRGITFVQHKDGTWERHLALNKFFNINQFECTDWDYEKVKNKKIVSVQDKADGSLIMFITLPNGNVVAKSKMSFESEQAQMAQRLFDHSLEMQLTVEYGYEHGSTMFWELTSPFNQIVLNYTNTELILLQVREADGRYHPNPNLIAKEEGLNGVERVDNELINDLDKQLGYNALDAFLDMKKTEEDIEGWIVTFEDGMMAKIKTDWYMELHCTIAELREDIVIEKVINNEIDDVEAMLEEGNEKLVFIENVKNIVQNYYNHTYKIIEEIIKGTDGMTVKEVALQYNGHIYFGIIMRAYKGGNIEDLLKDHILKNSNSLEKSRRWLESVKG